MKSNLNGRQIGQIIVSSLALALIIVWLATPSLQKSWFMGVPSNALVIIAMAISFFEEEKRKKKEGK